MWSYETWCVVVLLLTTVPVVYQLLKMLRWQKVLLLLPCDINTLFVILYYEGFIIVIGVASYFSKHANFLQLGFVIWSLLVFEWITFLWSLKYPRPPWEKVFIGWRHNGKEADFISGLPVHRRWWHWEIISLRCRYVSGFAVRDIKVTADDGKQLRMKLLVKANAQLCYYKFDKLVELIVEECDRVATIAANETSRERVIWVLQMFLNNTGSTCVSLADISWHKINRIPLMVRQPTE